MSNDDDIKRVKQEMERMGCGVPPDGVLEVCDEMQEKLGADMVCMLSVIGQRINFTVSARNQELLDNLPALLASLVRRLDPKRSASSCLTVGDERIH